MNRIEPAGRGGEARIRYLDGDYQILSPGAFVRCAVTGVAIPLDELKKTIAAFNEAVKSKKDPAFGRYINNDQVPMVDGPWYIGECQPKVHHCMGGLYTDLNCQVIDVRDLAAWLVRCAERGNRWQKSGA